MRLALSGGEVLDVKYDRVLGLKARVGLGGVGPTMAWISDLRVFTCRLGVSQTRHVDGFASTL